MSSSSSTTAAAKARDEVRTAGRGLVSITGAKLYFIITSYAVQLGLPRLLTSEEFGLYGSAMRVVSIVNNVLIVATVQSVSKLVSEDEAHAPATVRQALKIQLAVGCTLGIVAFSVAPMAAELVFLDPQLEPLFHVSAIVLLAYAMYAALVGSLNGRQLFQRQAGLDVSFSTLRTGGILGGAALGFGALGAMMGFASAAVTVFLVALLVVGIGQRGEHPSRSRWLTLMLPLVFYHVFLNATMMVDQPLLKRTVALLALENAGLEQVEAARMASRYAGFYFAAQTFAFVPYQLILSMTFIVFPMVSRATSEGDMEKTRETIRNAMRFSLLALLAIAAPISGAADGVMTLAYPDEYLAGAPALRLLVFGMVMFALFVVSATILSGSGRPLFAAIAALIAVTVVLSLNVGFVVAVGIGEHTLRAAALGTTLGMAVAMLAAGTAVLHKFRAWLPPVSVLRGLLAAAAAFGVAYVTPHGTPLMALVSLAAGFAAYVVALIAVRELGGRELDVVKRVLRRRG